jgi:hypothetical protein
MFIKERDIFPGKCLGNLAWAEIIEPCRGADSDAYAALVATEEVILVARIALDLQEKTLLFLVRDFCVFVGWRVCF